MIRHPLIASVILLAMLSVSSAHAQDADSLITRSLDPITVTAERTESALRLSTGSVSVLEARQIEQLPARSMVEALSVVPGILFLDNDGMGWNPQLVTRGFYGGGEAEYAVVLVDGIPVNNLENGLVNWEQLIREPGATVEVLRGGASSLYGDAAIGAVINIRTPANREPRSRLLFESGTHGRRSTQAFIEDDAWHAVADFGTSEGYRDHSRRSSASLSGQRKAKWGSNGHITLSGIINERKADLPGPIRSTDEGERTQSLGFFRFDNLEEQTRRATIRAERPLGPARLRSSLAFESRDLNQVRTIPLAAEFADTQERFVDASGWRAMFQWADWSLPMGLANTLTIGVDGYRGSLDSRYFQIATGGLNDAYAASNGGRQQLNADGGVNRTALAGYVHWDIRPVDRVKLSVGARYDRISDSFDAVEGLSEDADDATNTAFSPKAGVNVNYLSSSTQVGNVYASVSRSFKAATLDQLYDLRALPVPFPPFTVRIASAELEPQEGTAFEAGFYHMMMLDSGWQGRISTSVYTMDMENEIDFSFETFSNVNIGKSQHRGVEAGLSVERPGWFGVFANYTLQDVTQQSGDNIGKAVKAIPKTALSAGVSSEQGPFGAAIVMKSVSDIWIDDANTVALPDYSTLDVRLSLELADWRLSVDIHNALDEEYDTTAYPDPSGSDVLFLFPSAMRTVTLGARYRF